MAWCPMTVTDEPRWIGGLLSMRQGAYVLAGGVAEALLVKASHAPAAGAVLLAVLPFSLVYLLGWQKHNRTHEYLDRSLLRWWRYRGQTKVYVYRRRAGHGQGAG